MTVYAGMYGPAGLEYPDGTHVINKPISIKTLGGSLAVLYSDRHRTTTVSNPVSTDSLANLAFYAEPGEYLMQIEAWTQKIVVREDPLEPDVPLTPEAREAIIDDAVDEVLSELQTPVTLTLLFENALA